MRFALLRNQLSEDFKNALQCFESGSFEEAEDRFYGMLKQDPTNADTLYFLRLIERRLMPPPPPGPTSLIWQVDPAKMWEGDWVRTIISGCFSVEVVDGKWTATAPRMIVVDNGLVEHKVSYYRAAFYRGARIALVHLSDEAFRDDTLAYRYCETVLRNYHSEILAVSTGIHFFPLGYKAGFARPNPERRPASKRRYLWSFAGDAKKSSRGPMLEAMKSLPRGFLHLTQGFGSGDSLSTGDYRALLDDSIFVPCPGGWSNLESFRVYEALEAGAIPIVERRPAFDYFTALLGAHPIPTVGSWNEAVRLVKGLSPEVMESLGALCYDWWCEYKRRLKTDLSAIVTRALA